MLKTRIAIEFDVYLHIELKKEKCFIGRCQKKTEICVSDLKKDDRFEEVSAVHCSLIKDVIDDPYSPVFIEVKQNAFISFD